MFTISLLYSENIITTEKCKLQFKPKKNSTRVSLVYILLFSYNCMVAKVLSKIYHAMSKTKTNEIFSSKVSYTDKTTTTTNPHFSITKYTSQSASVHFLSKIHISVNIFSYVLLYSFYFVSNTKNMFSV